LLEYGICHHKKRFAPKFKSIPPSSSDQKYRLGIVDSVPVIEPKVLPCMLRNGILILSTINENVNYLIPRKNNVLGLLYSLLIFSMNIF
jgi:hypothetical protein